jgi:hypothetical protein
MCMQMQPACANCRASLASGGTVHKLGSQSAVCSAVLVTTPASGLDMYSNTIIYIQNNILHGFLSFLGVRGQMSEVLQTRRLADRAFSSMCAGTPVYALTDGTVCDPAKDSKCV